MWDLPRPGLEPVCPALAGRFSTTAPPGKPGFRVFNLICRAERLKALNSCSVPTLPCYLGIWLLFINIYFFNPALQQKAAITCTIIYEAIWRAMALAVIGFAQMMAAIPITRSMSEASCSPTTFPPSAHHSFYNAVKGSCS